MLPPVRSEMSRKMSKRSTSARSLLRGSHGTECRHTTVDLYGPGGRGMTRFGTRRAGLWLGEQVEELALGVPPHELPHGGLRPLAAEEDVADGLGNRHLDAHALCEDQCRPARGNAFDDHRGRADHVLHGHALTDEAACPGVPAMRAAARGYQI